MSTPAIVYTTLNGYSDLTDLVSTRIFPHPAPQGTTRPYVTYTTIGNTPANVMAGAGSASQDQRIMQVDVWADDYPGVQAAAAEAKNAMQQSFYLVSERDGYEQQTEAHRVSLDFSVWAANS